MKRRSSDRKDLRLFKTFYRVLANTISVALIWSSYIQSDIGFTDRVALNVLPMSSQYRR